MADQPAGIPPFTAAMLAREAEATLGEWLSGYTDPTEAEVKAGHQQRRMQPVSSERIEGQGGFTMDLRVQGPGEPDQVYRLTTAIDLIESQP